MVPEGGAPASTWFEQALESFRDALKLIDAEENSGLYGIVLHDIADTHRSAGDVQAAAAHYRKAVEHKRRAGDPLSLTTTMIALGDCLITTGEYTEARTALDQTRDVLNQDLDGVVPARRAVLLHNLAQSYQHLAKQDGQDDAYAAALDAYTATLDLLDTEADPGSYGTVLRNLGSLHQYRGDLHEAHIAWSDAVECLRRSESAEQILTTALIDLGRLRQRIGTRQPPPQRGTPARRQKGNGHSE